MFFLSHYYTNTSVCPAICMSPPSFEHAYIIGSRSYCRYFILHRINYSVFRNALKYIHHPPIRRNQQLATQKSAIPAFEFGNCKTWGIFQYLAQILEYIPRKSPSHCTYHSYEFQSTYPRAVMAYVSRHLLSQNNGLYDKVVDRIKVYILFLGPQYLARI